MRFRARATADSVASIEVAETTGENAGSVIEFDDSSREEAAVESTMIGSLCRRAVEARRDSEREEEISTRAAVLIRCWSSTVRHYK